MVATAEANPNNQQTNSSIDVTKEKNGGVLKTILKTGIEPDVHPAKGDTVFVHYSGVLKDTGEKFDSSRDRGDQPFSFSIGQGQVIKGWDLAVATMCRGEIASIECRSDYAYGASGSPPKIPPNSTLVFEVELLRFEGEDLSPDRDGSITKSIVVPGEKANCPVEHAPIKVHAVGSDLNGRVFYDRELEYVLGEGLEQQLPEGVDKALRRINKGEKCRVTLKPPFNYGTQPPAEFGLAPNEPILFTLFLKEFEKVKASWELMDNEKLEQALKLKERGTAFLNQEKFKLAISKYNAIVSLLEFAKPTFTEDPKSSEELAEKFKQTLVAAWLNIALASIKMGEMGEAIKCCEKVLEKMPDNVKAMYRKGQALQQRKDFEEAIEAYKRVQEMEPENKAAAQQIHECQKQINIMLERERKKYRGMFDRLAKENENGEEENKKE